MAMNGQFYLIYHHGTKYKVYFAPLYFKEWKLPPRGWLPPSVKERYFAKWGVAVVDRAWKTHDPRPRHLRAAPLGYKLQPAIQYLRDPIEGGVPHKEYRVCLDGHFWYYGLPGMSEKHPYYCFACG